jgi:predicted secreted hydrolase
MTASPTPPRPPGPKRRRLVPAALLGLTLLVAGSVFVLATRPRSGTPATIRFDDSSPASSAGFERALAPRDFVFPTDHGPHLGFQTEWWYYTGNVVTDDGRRFGYQLTFFRRGLTPTAPERLSDFATNQVYFAHFALTDVAGDAHTSAERFSRGAAGLAGATGQPYGVWLEDWRAEALAPDGSAVRLLAQQDGLALDLTLRAAKPLVTHGDRGLSPKSAEPGNASYYLSYTRLDTSGSVTAGGQTLAVNGQSWFDHEWSTSALGQGAIGWDWFSLQLDDGRELMYFQIRREDGSLEPVSGGTLVAADGTTRHLRSDEVQLDVLATWRSPDSGGQYPSRWRFAVPSEDLVLEIEPLVADQEMDVSFVYWEGAVRLSGQSRGAALGGLGYVELTGYVTSIAGQF